jgi:hypothetical protein
VDVNATALESNQSNQQAIATLTKRLAEMNTRIKDSAEQLASANAIIVELEKAQRQKVADEEKRKLVPPPLISDTGTYFFPKIVNRNGIVVMQDASYISIAANHLVVFRSADQTSKSFEIDEIHPLILEYLHINPGELKEKQRRIDAQGRIALENAKIQTAIGMKQDEERRRYDAQLAIEQQKALAAQQQANALQAQADADKQKADAILLNATKPSQNIQVIQQNKQTVGY